METETRSLTVIPPKRVRHKCSRPDAHRYKEATNGGRDDADDHNGMLLGGGVGVDCHGGRGPVWLCERALEWRREDLVIWASKGLKSGKCHFFRDGMV